MLRCRDLTYILNFLSLLQDLLTESSGYLLDELFLDIALHFSDILTSKWQNSTDAIDTVCETLQVGMMIFYLTKLFEKEVF